MRPKWPNPVWLALGVTALVLCTMAACGSSLPVEEAQAVPSATPSATPVPASEVTAAAAAEVPIPTGTARLAAAAPSWTPTPPSGMDASGPALPVVPVDTAQAIEAPTVPVSPAIPIPSGQEAQSLVEQARQDLARRLGVGLDQIALVEFQDVVWPDGSLGCPLPGMAYPQVITPGYRLVLEAEGQRYSYHTDGGRLVVWCEGDKGSGGLPSRGPDASVQDGWPNQTRHKEVIVLPPDQRK